MSKNIIRPLAATLALSFWTGAPGLSTPSAPLKIAVVGDATLTTVVLDQSAVPCGPSPYPAPCRYQDASPLAFSGVLQTATAGTVDVLASLSPAPPGATPGAPADTPLNQVPHIERDARVVIVAAPLPAPGESADQSIPAMQKLLAAIHERAPGARIVVLGLRDVPGIAATTIVDLNARARSITLAASASFVDMRTMFPATDYPDFPDAIHPSSTGSVKIAQAIVAKLPSGSAFLAMPSPSPAPPALATSAAPSNLPPLPSRKTRLNIAVIGSSMERNIVLDGSSVPCGIIERAAPCYYEDLSPLSYPTFLGALANATIYNLSVAGSQAADAKTSGTIPSALETQVPQIPTNVDVVILQIGLNDTSISGTVDSTLKRVDEVVDAVRARVPNARIIFISLRDYGSSIRSRIDAWNAREASVARSIGATVIDIRTPFSATDYTDFPDGTHASVIGSLRIAQLVEAVIDRMRTPPAPPK